MTYTLVLLGLDLSACKKEKKDKEMKDIVDNSNQKFNSKRQSKNNILKLDDVNSEVLLSNKDLLIFFDDPNNETNSEMKNIFMKASEEAEELYPSINSAILNVKNNKTMHKLNPNNTHKVILSKSDDTEIIGFFGEFQVKNLVRFTNKFYINPISFKVFNSTDLKKFVLDEDTLVYFGNVVNSKQFKIFKQVSYKTYDIVFAHCSEFECLQTFNAEEGSVMFFKKFYSQHEKPTLSSGFSEEQLTDFMKRCSLPPLSIINIKYLDRARSLKVPTLIVFREDRSESKKMNFFHSLRYLALERKKQNKPLVHFMIAKQHDQDDDIDVMLRLSKKDLPTAVLFDFSLEKPIKYKLTKNKDLSNSTIISFLEKWEKHELTPYFYTEKVPKKHSKKNPVVLVGSTLNQHLTTKDKDVLLLIYSKRTKDIKKTLKLTKKLRREYSNYDDQLLFAKINGDKNEIDGTIFEWSGQTAFIYYNSKTGIIKTFQGERLKKNILDFIEVNASFTFDRSLISKESGKIDKKKKKDLESIRAKEEASGEDIDDEYDDNLKTKLNKENDEKSKSKSSKKNKNKNLDDDEYSEVEIEVEEKSKKKKKQKEKAKEKEENSYFHDDL